MENEPTPRTDAFRTKARTSQEAISYERNLERQITRIKEEQKLVCDLARRWIEVEISRAQNLEYEVNRLNRELHTALENVKRKQNEIS